MAGSMLPMIEVRAVPAFRDNYIWLLCDSGPERHTAIVDPGDAVPVLRALEADRLTPVAILITHHHTDHTGGICELLEHYDLPVYGPATEAVPNLTHPLRDGDRITLRGLPTFTVMEVPGHTADHIAYIGVGRLFCGDTLFAGGCGRLFEGSPAQLYASLQRIASLPDDTWIYCAHEYTLANLHFAAVVEPGNPTLQARLADTRVLRQTGTATVPAKLGVEKQTNPFLRCAAPAVIAAATRHAGSERAPGLETFAELRRWKDHWRG